MAVLWLRWASFLAQQCNPNPEPSTLVIFGTKRINPEQWGQLHRAAEGLSRQFNLKFDSPPDEDEIGYPRSATHLFIRALEYSNRNWPAKATLWMETDCFPVAPDWFESVAKEYDTCGKPFMGVYVEHLFPHMAGCGIYPPDWDARAPLIRATLSAPDLPELYGEGKGQAWDTFAGSQTIAQLHRARTIQQIWRPGTFKLDNVGRVLTGTKLFHQCKNGSLIRTLASIRYPEFLKVPVRSDDHYMLFASSSRVVVADTEIEFTPCARGPGGCTFSVFKPETVMDEALLAGACGKRGINRISKDDYHSLIRQSHILRLA